MPFHAEPQGTPVFDAFDLDLVVKVLAHTLFSELIRHTHLESLMNVLCGLLGPFFTFFIPLFYIFQGAKMTDGVVVYSGIHCVAVSAFCEAGVYLKPCRLLIQKVFFRVHEMDLNAIQESRKPVICS